MRKVLFLLWATLALGADPTLFIFQKVDPYVARQSATDFRPFKVSAELNAALGKFQTDPSMVNAIGMLKYYNEMAKLTKAEREALFNADTALFRTMDKAKYELVMHARIASGALSSRRVGSSGRRELAYILNAMGLGDPPVLDAAKVGASDDDVTNLSEFGQFEADEAVNGGAAEQAFEKTVHETFGYQGEFTSKDIQLEFLSPTIGWEVFVGKNARWEGETPILDEIEGIRKETATPKILMDNAATPPLQKAAKEKAMREYLQRKALSEIPAENRAKYLALTASNPEKYNDPFGVWMINKKWANGAGVMTDRVDDPLHTTHEIAVEDLSKDPPPPEDKFAYIAGNFRQVYEVHKGEFKYQCKYYYRMFEAWALVFPNNPEIWQKWEADALIAKAIYDGKTSYEDHNKVKVTITDADRVRIEKDITAMMDNIVLEAHKAQVDRMLAELTKVLPDLKGKRLSEITAEDLEGHAGLVEELNGLAVGYINLSPEMYEQVLNQLAEEVKNGQDSNDPARVFRAGVLKRVMLIVQERSKAVVRDIASFATLRHELSKRISTVLTSADIDIFLRRLAGRKLGNPDVVMRGDRAEEVDQITEDDALRHLNLMETIAKAFGDPDVVIITRTKEYIAAGVKANPGMPIRLLAWLWDIYDSSKTPPVEEYYNDEHGNRLRRVAVPSGLSLGINVYAVVCRGGAMWGNIQNGGDLFKKLLEWYTESNGDKLVAGQRQAAILIDSVNLANLFAENSSRLEWLKSSTLWQETNKYVGFNSIGLLASNGGAVGVNSDATMDLVTAAAKDAVIMYARSLAGALIVLDVAKWGYSEFKLKSERENLVQALVQNGVWEPSNVREMNDPAHYTAGELPKLKKILWNDGNSQDEMDGARFPKVNYDPSAYVGQPKPRFMTLRESGTKVDPRATLVSLLYDSGLDTSDVMLKASLDAAKEYAGNWISRMLRRAAISNNPQDWTGDYMKGLGFNVQHPQDDSLRHAEPDEVKLESYDVPAGYSDRQLKLLGLLVSDVWFRQQVLIEQKLLPDILRDASRLWLDRLKKQSIESGQLKSPEAREEIYAIVQKVDEKVWPEIAWSEFPAAQQRPRDAAPPYDPKRDGTPIRKAFEESAEVSLRVRDITKYQEFLDSGSEMYVDKTELDVRLPRTVVLQKVGDLLNEIRQYAYKVEDAYNQVLTTLDQTNKMIKAESEWDASPYHVQLDPAATSITTMILHPSKIGDPALGALVNTTKFRETYNNARQQVVDDIQNNGKYVSWLRGLSNQMQAAATQLATGKDQFTPTVSTNQLWTRMTRLRYQIATLDEMARVSSYINPMEMASTLGSMRIKTEGDAASHSIAENQKLMEDEYNELKKILGNFVTLSLRSSASTLYLGNELEISSSAAVNPLVGEVTLGPNGLPGFLTTFNWKLLSDATGASFTAQTNGPEWRFKPTKAGKYKLSLQVLDSGGNQVGAQEGPEIEVRPLTISGTVTTLTGNASPAQAQLLAGPAVLRMDGAGASLMGAISQEITEYDEKTWGQAQATIVVSLGPQRFQTNSSAIDANLGGGVLTIRDPLVLRLPYAVSVSVEANDRSKTPIDGVTVTVRTRGESMSGNPATVIVMENDPISADVEYPSLGIRVSTQSVQAKAGQLSYTLTAELPMLDRGNLKVSGKVVTDPASRPSPIRSGTLTTNIGTPDLNPGDSGGQFEFTNDKAIDLRAGGRVEVTAAALRDAAGRSNNLKSPVTRSIGAENRLDLGEIVVTPAAARIQIYPKDWNGAPLTIAQGPPVVSVAGVPIPYEGAGVYSGTYSFLQDSEEILVEANFPVAGVGADALMSVAQAKVSASQAGGVGNQGNGNPVRVDLRLPFYLPNTVTVNGSTRIVPLKDRSTPGMVDLGDSSHLMTNTVLAGRFQYRIDVPVQLSENITLRASANDGDVFYLGAGQGQISGDQPVVDLGEIVLQATSSADLPPGLGGPPLTPPTSSLPPGLGGPQPTSTLPAGFGNDSPNTNPTPARTSNPAPPPPPGGRAVNFSGRCSAQLQLDSTQGYAGDSVKATITISPADVAEIGSVRLRAKPSEQPPAAFRDLGIATDQGKGVFVRSLQFGKGRPGSIDLMYVAFDTTGIERCSATTQVRGLGDRP